MMNHNFAKYFENERWTGSKWERELKVEHRHSSSLPSQFNKIWISLYYWHSWWVTSIFFLIFPFFHSLLFHSIVVVPLNCIWVELVKGFSVCLQLRIRALACGLIQNFISDSWLVSHKIATRQMKKKNTQNS